MAYKDIVVHVDNGRHCADRLDTALALAAAHQAHVIGVFVRTDPYVPPYVQAQFGPEVIALQERHAGEAAERARTLFEGKAAAAGINYEWRAPAGDLLDMVSLTARYADLTVIGQADQDAEDAFELRQLSDHLILDAGRPVLLVPYAGRFPVVGERVLVAWNASREATRAINDAIPLLTRAKKVDVVAINPERGLAAHGDVPGADICLHLARHGVKAVAEHVRAEDIDVGAMLLSRAADLSADLIVMGAYGRSRLRELVLGGATRHLLQHMTVPVLMAH